MVRLVFLVVDADSLHREESIPPTTSTASADFPFRHGPDGSVHFPLRHEFDANQQASPPLSRFRLAHAEVRSLVRPPPAFQMADFVFARDELFRHLHREATVQSAEMCDPNCSPPGALCPVIDRYLAGPITTNGLLRRIGLNSSKIEPGFPAHDDFLAGTKPATDESGSERGTITAMEELSVMGITGKPFLAAVIQLFGATNTNRDLQSRERCIGSTEHAIEARKVFWG